ncbi:MAG TPA: FtsX-like permease family protein [Candidatus Methylomirabilis sp.]|jgi:putative ABC transport system permease protein
MRIPLKYNVRNLLMRRTSTAMTILGIAAVVAVFIGLNALSRGLQEAFVTSGEPENLIVLREGAQVETNSAITREGLHIIRYLDGIATAESGEPLVSPEVVVLVNLRRRADNEPVNVLVRGVSPPGYALRPGLRVVAGRPPRPGRRELIVSRTMAERFQNLAPGEQVRLAKSHWTVVGLFDAGRSAFASEIWGDALEIAEEFDRRDFSSVLLRTGGPAAQGAIVRRIRDDRRLHLKAQPEPAYYDEQTKSAAPIKVLGTFIATLMAIGACFAVMNTMYAAVAWRGREIATLQVLGFPRRSILVSFLVESLILAAVGGAIGCALALPIHGVSTGTANWRTFSEVVFAFRITPDLLARGFLFALVMGALGGILPARLAARQVIVRTLRAI